MRVEDVVLFFENQKLRIELDVEPLHWGATLHLALEGPKPMGFFEARPGTVAFKVGDISRPQRDGRYVSLFRAPRISPALGPRLLAATRGELDLLEIDRMIDTIGGRIPFDRVHDTLSVDASPLGRAAAVLDRLELVETLRRPEVGSRLWLRYRGLVAYLMLTCFDLLGQPADWVDFSRWLESSRHQTERERVVVPVGTSSIEAARAFVEAHAQLYGVRRSFRRFIEKVLDPEQRQALLACIEIEVAVAPPLIGENDAPKSLGESKKIDWLFDLRNRYTHAAFYVPGGHDEILPAEMRSDEDRWVMDDELSATQYTHRTVRRWPAILEETVRKGLVRYMRMHTEQQRTE